MYKMGTYEKLMMKAINEFNIVNHDHDTGDITGITKKGYITVKESDYFEMFDAWLEQ